MDDLRAFWVLARLLGPTYHAGLFIRYNSAYVATSFIFLLAATFGVVVSASSGTVEWGVTAELGFCFIAGAISVFLASIMCVRLNGLVPSFAAVSRRAALAFPALGGVAKDICADLATEHQHVEPYKIMYMTATPALISFLWSSIMVLAGVLISFLPSVCIPMFITSSCRK